MCVGKTELIEQTYHDRNIIKIEGLERVIPIDNVNMLLRKISRYMNDSLYSKIQVKNWVEVFENDGHYQIT